MADSVSIALLIGIVFAPLGGLTAAIITLAEYRQHVSRRAAVVEAVRMGLLATVILAAATTVAGWLMGRT
jgi:hypothetical protein